ncbi:hypothetical protein BK648_21695 [Pseudomonas poae]|uniref:Uncharacterized protein n=1 Tax=Pseudomonas poae TaxID=200451 RepID=A0A423EQ36_9PSED|nr:hypothetical protein [Pseudomonas poae]ROM33428.1 hypothetical protein BK648_21695 [Pseudomonas poae]
MPLIPTGTTGTCTATVQGDSDFSTFAAAAIRFFPNDALKTWTIIASAQDAPITQLMTLSIPNEGHVTNKQYPIGGSPGSGFSAFWVKSIFGTWHNYQGLSGTATVTVDEALETLVATFSFTAVSGSKTVQIARGTVDVQGFSDNLRTHDSGSVTAQVSGSVNVSYQSTQVSMTHETVPNFPPSVLGWSRHYEPRPGNAEYVLSMRFADNLTPGTYPITDTSQNTRFFFYDLNRRFVSFLGISGQVTVESLPPAGTVTGQLKGSFQFIGSTSDDGETITVSNGQFVIQK